jgi:outer membrane protein
MKNVLLVWNIILTALAGYLLYSHLNTGGSVKAGVKSPVSDSSNNGVFRIAYLDMDSIESNWEMVKEVKVEQTKQEEEYSTSVNQLDITYRNKVNELNEKTKSPSMTKEEYERGQMDLMQLQERLKNRKMELDQKYQNFVMTRNLNIKKKIEDFLKEYNKNKYYSYILVYDPGFIYYKDEAYNITGDVIKGLNERYKKKE